MTWWQLRLWLCPAPIWCSLQPAAAHPLHPPVPTVKISSNSKLAGHKNNWIDFNAGRMVEDKTKEELAEELLGYVLEVASGRKVKSEEAGFHDMAIFKQGVTL